MLYRGCLRCNRVINLVALFPINYPQCYKKKLITHQRGPTPESLLTTLTNRELPQFAHRLIYLFPTQSEAGRKIPANWILLSFVLPSHLCHWKTLCNNSEECLQLKLSLFKLQIREGLLLLLPQLAISLWRCVMSRYTLTSAHSRPESANSKIYFLEV